jgi:Trk K+ transport system NAD-binding subunit
MNHLMPGAVLGVDYDNVVVEEHNKSDRNVVTGDGTNPEFWDRVNMSHKVEYALLVMPDHNAQVATIKQTRKHGFKGKIAASAKHQDELEQLQELGVEAAFNIYAEVGTGFATLTSSKFGLLSIPSNTD